MPFYERNEFCVNDFYTIITCSIKDIPALPTRQVHQRFLNGLENGREI